MSNKSTFKTPIKRATLQRNAFDLSRRDVFSCNAGELIPIVSLEVNPNEHFEIRPDIFLRTQSMNTAAYARCRQNVEFFFVPYRALWSKADQFFTGSNFNASSIFNESVPRLAPRFHLSPSKVGCRPGDNLYSWVYYYGYGSGVKDYRDKNIFNLNLFPGTRKLLDMLGYGLINIEHMRQINPSPTSPSEGIPGQYATIFRLAAYQKIYQDHFRLPLFESYDNGCNIDDLQGTAANDSIVIPINNAFIKRFGTLRYSAWKSDYFTNLRAGDTLYLSLWMSDAFQGSATPLVKDRPYLIDDQYNMDAQYGVHGPMSEISATGIRTLYALERMMDSMSRAKDGTYSSQMEARFGIKPLIDPHLQCTYLGGSDAPVMIGEVTSTAQTTDVAGDVSGDLGRVAGKGTSQSQSRTISFTAREHGIIMGIFYIQPESEYSATGLDPMLSKFQREEYFTPELDKLGFAPVCVKELMLTGSGHSLANNVDSDIDNQVIGFNPMYSEYKTAIDKCHGDFVQGGSLSAWTTPRIYGDVKSLSAIGKGFTLRFLRVNPATMDSIFAVQSTEADQFLVNAWHDIRAIRPMSINGLPYCG